MKKGCCLDCSSALAHTLTHVVGFTAPVRSISTLFDIGFYFFFFFNLGVKHPEIIVASLTAKYSEAPPFTCP